MALNDDRKAAVERLRQKFSAVTEIRDKLHDSEQTGKEELSQQFDRAYEELKQVQAEIQRIDGLLAAEATIETMTRPEGQPLPRGTTEDAAKRKKEAHARGFNAYLRTKVDHDANRRAMEHLSDFGPQEVNALLGTDDTLGGFTVPEDFRAELLRALAGFAAVRMAGARVVPTGRDTLVFPTVKSGTDPYSSDLTSGNTQTTGGNENWKPQGHTTGGAAPPQQSKPTFGQERIPVHIWQPNAVELTRELLDDSVVPLESLLASLFGEIKALDEDWAFILGDSVEQPEGILNSGGATVNTGDANTVTYNGLLDLYYAVPAQYRTRPTFAFLMRSSTFGAILKLTTSNSLVFQPGRVGGVDADAVNILGRRVVFSEFMPALAASSKSIIAGDFSQFVIAERTDMRIQRLVERFAPNVGILPHARLGGQVVRKEAFRIQNTSA